MLLVWEGGGIETGGYVTREGSELMAVDIRVELDGWEGNSMCEVQFGFQSSF